MGRRYTEEECDLAKSVTLFEYLSKASPNDIKHISGDEYILKSNTYVHFHKNNPMWIMYNGGRVGGATALKYLMITANVEYPDAIGMILDEMHLSAFTPTISPGQIPPVSITKKDTFALPPKAENYRRVFAYLAKTRCIDTAIIEELMKSGRLYEEADRHNCIFVGYDFNGKAVYGMRRGTTPERFVGDVKGSSKAYAFSLYLENHDTLIVCESPIDVLSAASLIRMHGGDHKKYAYTSLSGIYTPSKDNDGKLPNTLEMILDHYQEISQIVLCFDGDEQGKSTTEYLAVILSGKGYAVRTVDLDNNMDINDFLCMYKNILSTIEGKS